MKGLVADNEEEHRSGRALVAALRHVPPTSPANLNFLKATANSGEFSCKAREVLGLPQCKPLDFVHTKAGIAVLTLVCVLVALGTTPLRLFNLFHNTLHHLHSYLKCCSCNVVLSSVASTTI